MFTENKINEIREISDRISDIISHINKLNKLFEPALEKDTEISVDFMVFKKNKEVFQSMPHLYLATSGGTVEYVPNIPDDSINVVLPSKVSISVIRISVDALNKEKQELELKLKNILNEKPKKLKSK